MKASLLLSLMLLTSCGNPFALHKDQHKHTDPRPILTTDPTFIKYIDLFEAEYGKMIGDIPINFALISKPQTVAWCNEWNSGERNVEVSQPHWNSMSESQKEELIFHELGHCELNLDHDDTYDTNDSCPTSLMNPYVFGNYETTNCYIPKYDYYMRQLFKR
jgi:Zn-dependent protease with chaperone function